MAKSDGKPDPYYDEGTQPNYGTDFADTDGDDSNVSQKLRRRPQK